MFDELEKYVREVSKSVQNMLEWAKTQTDEEWLKTEEGKKLLLDIGQVGAHNAYLYFDMAAIEAKQIE